MVRILVVAALFLGVGFSYGLSLDDAKDDLFLASLELLSYSEQTYPHHKSDIDKILVGVHNAANLVFNHAEATDCDRDFATSSLINTLEHATLLMPSSFQPKLTNMLSDVKSNGCGELEGFVDFITVLRLTPQTPVQDYILEIRDFQSNHPSWQDFSSSLYLGSVREQSLRGNHAGATKLIQAALKDHPNDNFLADLDKKVALVSNSISLVTTKLDGTQFTLANFGKPALLFSWCSTCNLENTIKHIKYLHGKYKSDGLEVVALSFDKDKQALQSYIQTHHLDWLHLHEPDATKAKQILTNTSMVVGGAVTVTASGKRNSLNLFFPREMDFAIASLFGKSP